MNFISPSLGLNERGHLTLGGADVPELAKEYGTPLYLMDENRIRANCRAFTAAMKEFYPGDGNAAYASKAFCCTHIYRILREENLLTDVASGGEMYTALNGGMPPEKIVFHGSNKTYEELRYALKAGIYRVVVNGTEELGNISRVAGGLGTAADVTLRLSPGVTVDAHSAAQTGKLDTKFGIPIETGAAMEAVKLALSLDGIRLNGVHCHLGSPVYEIEPYIRAAEVMTGFMARVRDVYGVTLKELTLGGGFAVPYLTGQTAPAIGDYIAAVSGAVTEACEKHGLPLPELTAEPGRSIVADAGITVYTVGNVKEIPGVRTYISVDGGMTDNPRYMLYGSRYEITLPERAGEDRTQTVTLAGRCCENELLGSDMSIQTVKPGDLLAVLNTGAYNYSMASHYNRIPKPPVVMVRDGVPSVAVRRETWEDMTAFDI